MLGVSYMTEGDVLRKVRFACLTKSTRLEGVMPSILFAAPYESNQIEVFRAEVETHTKVVGLTLNKRSFTSELNPSTT